MPGFHSVSLALRDLADDVAYHGLNVVQGAFDLVCVAALGACVYATSLDGSAAPMGPLAPEAAQISGLPAVGAPVCLVLSDPALPAQGGCITAQVLDASIGT